MVLDFPTLDQFLLMIADYNTTFWPLQIAAYALGLSALILAVWKTGWSSKAAAAVLVVFWLWVGVVFNGLYFPRLVSAAVAFAVLFVIEGILLFYTGVVKQHLSFKAKPDLYGVVGGVLILYSLAGYPLIEYLLGRGYPKLLFLGMAPCPTAVFTLGLFLWTDKELPKYVLIIPILYAISGTLPVYLGIVEDVGMILAGLAAMLLLVYRERAKI